MAAPTPVSAYLHAAAMVKAGVYLVARFAPAYSTDPHVACGSSSCSAAGPCCSAVTGRCGSTTSSCILAFGTVSQLGLIILLVGWADGAIALAGLAMLGAHAMFKAALFLVGRRRRRRHRHARPAAALRACGRELQADRARGRAGDGVDDRAAAVRGLRRPRRRGSRRSGTWTTRRPG